MQFLTDWNMYQLLGSTINRSGTSRDLSLDYMSKRGFGYGTTFKYDRGDFFGIEGRTVDYRLLGNLRPWSGQPRPWPPRVAAGGIVSLPIVRPAPRDPARRFSAFGRVGFNQRSEFPRAIPPREYDELKDESTDVELKKIDNNMSWNVLASTHLENFVTQTEWLPKLDRYWLGQPLLNDTFTWYEHTSIGFAKFQTLQARRHHSCPRRPTRTTCSDICPGKSRPPASL